MLLCEFRCFVFRVEQGVPVVASVGGLSVVDVGGGLGSGCGAVR